MGQRELLLFIAQLLDKYKIPYLLTGSFAVSYYGFPRATHDIDFVVEISSKKYSNLEQALINLDKSYIVDLDDIKKAITELSTFNILHLDSGIKIDFWPAGQDDFELSKFERGKKITLFKNKIRIISPEDLILTKLFWCKEIISERHRGDCIGIWKVRGGKLDKKYLAKWAKKLKIEELLQEISTANY